MRNKKQLGCARLICAWYGIRQLLFFNQQGLSQISATHWTLGFPTIENVVTVLVNTVLADEVAALAYPTSGKVTVLATFCAASLGHQCGLLFSRM